MALNLDKIIKLRHELHQNPELSGVESNTAATIVDFLSAYEPDEIYDKLSGTAVVAIYNGADLDGPTILFRCELDALPIMETGNIPYISDFASVAHSCGHDGHMAIIGSLAMQLHAQCPKSGRVVLVFQPAEETGKGAKPLVEALKVQKIIPEYSFALHNMPKYKMHQIIIKNDHFNCASVGMKINLFGRTSHASHPENGISSSDAMCEILTEVKKTNQEFAQFEAYTSATITHAALGEESFGVSAGDAKIMLCLRSESDSMLQKLKNKFDILVQKVSSKYGLGYDIGFDEAFEASINNNAAADLIRQACVDENLELLEAEKSWRPSEDFGQFANISKSAMFMLGSGVDTPQLHNPDFNFPDELIKTGNQMFMRLIKNLVG